MKIIFCGGCNPLYDRVKIYEKLKDELEYNNSYDFLILNGCHRGCRKVESNFKIISMQDFFIENSYDKDWTEEKILNWIHDKLKTD